MQVFFNGKFVAQNKAKVSVFDAGFLHGEGLFETILIQDSKTQFFREHLVRLRREAKWLGIKVPFPETKIMELADQLIKKNKITNGSLRINLTPDSFIIFARLPFNRPTTVKVCFIMTERCLPQVKSLSYLPTVLAQREAAQRGYDEALLVDRTGYVTEGGRTNFFWIKAGKVFTPVLNDALPGITRSKVIELVKKLRLPFTEQKVKPTQLRQADEIFLTNAPMEVWPVAQLEKRKLKIGELTQRIRAAYLKKYG